MSIEPGYDFDRMMSDLRAKLARNDMMFRRGVATSILILLYFLFLIGVLGEIRL